jgi:hypothetical protein
VPRADARRRLSDPGQLLKGCKRPGGGDLRRWCRVEIRLGEVARFAHRLQIRCPVTPALGDRHTVVESQVLRGTALDAATTVSLVDPSAPGSGDRLPTRPTPLGARDGSDPGPSGLEVRLDPPSGADVALPRGNRASLMKGPAAAMFPLRHQSMVVRGPGRPSQATRQRSTPDDGLRSSRRLEGITMGLELVGYEFRTGTEKS